MSSNKLIKPNPLLWPLNLDWDRFGGIIQIKICHIEGFQTHSGLLFRSEIIFTLNRAERSVEMSSDLQFTKKKPIQDSLVQRNQAFSIICKLIKQKNEETNNVYHLPCFHPYSQACWWCKHAVLALFTCSVMLTKSWKDQSTEMCSINDPESEGALRPSE